MEQVISHQRLIWTSLGKSKISRHIFTSVTNLTSRPRDSEEDATAFSPIEMISTNSDLAREMHESVSCAFSTGGFEMASQLLFTGHLRYLKRIASQDAGWLLVQRAAHFPSAVTATDAASLSSVIHHQATCLLTFCIENIDFLLPFKWGWDRDAINTHIPNKTVLHLMFKR